MIKAALLRILPASMISLLRIILRRYRALFVFYETSIAPFIAFRLSFLLWPIFKICETCNLCFLNNIPDGDGIGHITVETDDFFRKRFLDEIDSKKEIHLNKKAACNS